MTRRAKTGHVQNQGGSSCDEARSTPGLRKAYHPPRLERYGRLTDLTRFGGSEIVDSGGGLGDQP